MDPIAAITTFVQVVKSLKSLREKYKSAPELVKDLYDECTTTQTVLVRVNEIVGKRGEATELSYSQKRVMNAFNTDVEALDKVLIAFKGQLSKFSASKDSKVADFRGSRRSPVVWNDSYLTETLGKIRSRRDSVDFVLSSIQLDSINNIQETISNALPGRPGVGSKQDKSAEIMEALETTNLSKLRRILAGGGDPNRPLGTTEYFALHTAATNNDVPMIQLLFEYGAVLDPADLNLETPLHTALRSCHVEATTVLINLGADISRRGQHDCTALYYAIKSQLIKPIKYLLGKGADPNVQTHSGWTPLMKLVTDGRAGTTSSNLFSHMVQLLLLHGADPTIGLLENGKTPLHVIAGNKSLSKELELMANTVKSMGKSVDLPQKHGLEMPLFCAAWANNSEGVNILVLHGADVNHKTEGDQLKYDSCPLAAAVYNDAFASAEALLEANANPQGVLGQFSPLHVAMYRKITPVRLIMQLLLRYGADKDSPDPRGLQPIHVAAANGKVEAIRILVDAGVDVNALRGGDRRWSPFMEASANGHVHAMTILKDLGADWQYRGPDGVSAFVAACVCGQMLCATYLLGMGADIDEKMASGRTALHYAARNGHLEMAQFLLQMGIDADAELNSQSWGRVGIPRGTKAAEVARLSGHDKTAKTITEFGEDSKIFVWETPSSRD